MQAKGICTQVNNIMSIDNPKTSYIKRDKFINPDECYTPEYAIIPLIQYLNKGCKIWDCAYGSGRLASHFKKHGFEVVGDNKLDFFNTNLDCDIICTNPPYSKKDEFLHRAFELGTPFAFLLPLTTLEGINRGKMFKENQIQMIIPNRRINFEIPSNKKSAWFATAWFCWNLNLPKDLMFVELEREIL